MDENEIRRIVRKIIDELIDNGVIISSTNIERIINQAYTRFAIEEDKIRDIVRHEIGNISDANKTSKKNKDSKTPGLWVYSAAFLIIIIWWLAFRQFF